MKVKMMCGDCLDKLKDIEKDSIDLILADPPYGLSSCKWDTPIKLEPLWKELRRVAKENAAIVIFGEEPFSSVLRSSNLRMYRYDWLWQKDRAGNFGAAKYQPLNYYENISVFYRKCQYYPIMEDRVGRIRDRRKDKSIGANQKPNELSGGGAMNHGYSDDYDPTKAYPKRVLRYKRELGLHDAQKPVDLLKYLIKSYTDNPNQTVLDFCMGSASTAVAAIQINRNFIGIEIDNQTFKGAVSRVMNLSNRFEIEI